MILSPFFTHRLLTWANRLRNAKAPDLLVHGAEGVYLRRWYVIPRNPFFNIYIHNFLHSDENRALHDHMYVSLSLILSSGYREHFKDRIILRPVGAVTLRRPSTPHRIELLNGLPALTIFITGPRVRRWGFYCPRGWVYWKDFVQLVPGGNKAGKGC